jgi:hypothetical protein
LHDETVPLKEFEQDALPHSLEENCICMNPANTTLNSTIVSLSLASTGTQTESNSFTKAPYILRETKEICRNCGEKGDINKLQYLSWWLHATLFYVYFSFIQYITGHHITQSYIMRQAFMSGAAVISHGSRHIVAMRLGQTRFFSMELVVLSI